MFKISFSLTKNLKLIYQGKFLVLILGSLLIYTLYIQFGYSNIDVLPYNVYVLKDSSLSYINNNSPINYSASEKLIGKQVKEDKNGIGVLDKGLVIEFIYHEDGNIKKNNLKVDYANVKKNNLEIDISVVSIGENNRKLKLIKEMTCEVLFFEIVAVGFLGIAALFFQEKQLGILNVFGILPVNIWKELIIKILMFLFIDLLFATILILVNIGFSNNIFYLFRILIYVSILSVIMTNLGMLFSLYFNDFKQFGVIYTFLTIFMTAPIFLVANTSINIDIMKYNYFYIMYLNMKNIFFGGKVRLDLFYLISFIIISILYTLIIKKYKKILQGG